MREATRFKSTLGGVDVPSRDRKVVEEAVRKAKGTVPRAPQEMVRGVFSGEFVCLHFCFCGLGMGGWDEEREGGGVMWMGRGERREGRVLKS